MRARTKGIHRSLTASLNCVRGAIALHNTFHEGACSLRGLALTNGHLTVEYMKWCRYNIIKGASKSQSCE